MRTTRRSLGSALLFTCLFLCCLRPVSAQAPSQTPVAPVNAAAVETTRNAVTPASSAEEKPIRDLVGAFAKAYSGPDLKALAAYFTDEANVVDSAGETTRGRSAIIEMYASSFEENPGLYLVPKVEELRFLTPDVARVEGLTRPGTRTGDATEFTRFSSLLVKRDEVAGGRDPRIRCTLWRPFQATNDSKSSSGWLVIEVDESGNVKAHSNVRWAFDNNSF